MHAVIVTHHRSGKVNDDCESSKNLLSFSSSLFYFSSSSFFFSFPSFSSLFYSSPSCLLVTKFDFQGKRAPVRIRLIENQYIKPHLHRLDWFFSSTISCWVNFPHQTTPPPTPLSHPRRFFTSAISPWLNVLKQETIYLVLAVDDKCTMMKWRRHTTKSMQCRCRYTR